MKKPWSLSGRRCWAEATGRASGSGAMGQWVALDPFPTPIIQTRGRDECVPIAKYFLCIWFAAHVVAMRTPRDARNGGKGEEELEIWSRKDCWLQGYDSRNSPYIYDGRSPCSWAAEQRAEAVEISACSANRGEGALFRIRRCCLQSLVERDSHAGP